MITPEQHAEIRRLYFGEHWKVGKPVARRDWFLDVFGMNPMHREGIR